MLDVDYTTRFAELIDSVDWKIELPIEWKDYFSERGEASIFEEDERQNQRLKVRAYGLMWFDRALPFCPRSRDPMGIYTRDFSRHGMGFLAPVELYPEEFVRLALPNFWVRLQVVRTRRITSLCYEIGTVLVERHDPSPEVFEVDAAAPAF